MGRKGTGSTPTVECDRCGEQISKIYLRTHQKTPACEAAANKLAMKRSGLAEVGAGDLVTRVLRAIDPSMVQSVFTEFTPARFRREAKRETSLWVPRWVANLLHDEWELTKNLDESTALYTDLIRRAIGDPEFRETLETVRRMGDARAVRAYVETSRMRAHRLVKEARRLQGEADKLIAQALAEDPEALS